MIHSAGNGLIIKPDQLDALLDKERIDFSPDQIWRLIEVNTNNWAAEVSASPFWQDAKSSISQWRQEYRASHGAALLEKPDLPQFQSKSIDSIKLKLCRKLAAGKALDQILVGEMTPVPVLSDLVRTRVECAYIDGVVFLADKLRILAETHGLKYKREVMGKIEGYYAQHIDIELDVFLRVMGGSQPFKLNVEIQLATSFATKMWNATHELYEVDRVNEEAGRADLWQWDPSNPRFISHQLGHMMHLADGLLVNLRKSKRDEN